MSLEARDVLRIVGAYGEVLGRIASSVTYLLYLAASILSGWATGLIFSILGVNALSLAIVLAIFASSFTMAGMASSILLRIVLAHRLAMSSPEERDRAMASGRRFNAISGPFWVLGFAAGFPLVFMLVPAEIRVVAIPMAITVGIATGYLGLFLAGLAAYGWLDPRPLFVSLYLYASLPTYLLAASQPLDMSLTTAAYALLTIHTSLSILVAACWYILAARRRASGILHAARGED